MPAVSRLRLLGFSVLAITLGLAVVEAGSALVLHVVPALVQPDARSEPGAPGSPENLPYPVVHFRSASNPLTTTDAELVFRLVENPTGERRAGYEGINAQGWRGRPFEPSDLATDNLRLVTAGDSCTFGWEIPGLADSYPARLEQELAARAHRPVRVYNLGVPGYSSFQVRHWLERMLPRLKPHVLVLYVGWNDITKTPSLSDAELSAVTSPGLIWLVRVLAKTHFGRLIGALAGKLRTPDSAARLPSQKQRVQTDETIENIQRVARLVHGQGGRLMLVAPPFTRKRQAPIMFSDKEDMAALWPRLESAFRDDDIAIVHVPEMEDGAAAAETFFGPDGFHPNAVGAMTLAKHLAADIAQQWPNLMNGPATAPP
jgi:lysophospholipase L1-like esterase